LIVETVPLPSPAISGEAGVGWRQPARRMICVVRKTIDRTGRFLSDALAWRAGERQHAPIAWSLVAGWIWLLTALRGDTGWCDIALAALYLSVVLAAVCAIDARYGIIPDSLVAALAFGGLLDSAFISEADWLQRLLETGLFFIAAWLFRAAFRRIRGYHGLGYGDVKFATAGVLWIGIGAVPHLLIVAVLSAFVSLLILKAAGQSLNRRQAISFGPHLAVSLWLNWIAITMQPGF